VRQQLFDELIDPLLDEFGKRKDMHIKIHKLEP